MNIFFGWECLYCSFYSCQRYRKKAPNGQKNMPDVGPTKRNRKGSKGQKDAERVKTPNNIIIQIFSKNISTLSAALRWKEARRSWAQFLFQPCGHAAILQPKRQRNRSFHYKIGTPLKIYWLNYLYGYHMNMGWVELHSSSPPYGAEQHYTLHGCFQTQSL